MTKTIKRMRSDISFTQSLLNDELQYISELINEEYQINSSTEMTGSLEIIMRGDYLEECPAYINERVTLLHYYNDSFKFYISELQNTYPGVTLVAEELTTH